MQKKDIYLKDLKASQELAKELTDYIGSKQKGLVFLKGDLGAGKTTLVQMILKNLGWTERVKSPTYSLVEPYEVNGLKLYHLDLYRIHTPDELYFMGLQDLFAENAWFLIEWPERLQHMRLKPDIILFLEIDKQNEQARTGWIGYA